MTCQRSGRTAPIPPTAMRVGSEPVAPKTRSAPQRRRIHGPDRRRPVRATDLRPDQQVNPAHQSAHVTVRGANIGALDPPPQTLSP
jgi:hypothetical protein